MNTRNSSSITGFPFFIGNSYQTKMIMPFPFIRAFWFSGRTPGTPGFFPSLMNFSRIFGITFWFVRRTRERLTFCGKIMTAFLSTSRKGVAWKLKRIVGRLIIPHGLKRLFKLSAAATRRQDRQAGRLKNAPPVAVRRIYQARKGELKKMETEKKFELNSNHLPLGVCRECLESPEWTRGNSLMMVSFCRHNHSFATLELTKDGQPSGPWRIISPVSLSEAKELLERGNKILEGFLEKQVDAELRDAPEGAFFKA
jgi:hypothetical protein